MLRRTIQLLGWSVITTIREQSTESIDNTQDNEIEYRNDRDIRNWYEPNKELNRLTTYNQVEF